MSGLDISRVNRVVGNRLFFFVCFFWGFFLFLLEDFSFKDGLDSMFDWLITGFTEFYFFTEF